MMSFGVTTAVMAMTVMIRVEYLYPKLNPKTRNLNPNRANPG